jgi:hypothetical protein
LPASVAPVDLPKGGPLAFVATLRQAAEELVRWITAGPSKEAQAAEADLAKKAAASVEFAGVYTHQVLRAMTAYGRAYRSGEYADASDWPSRALLEADGTIRPIPHDPRAAVLASQHRAKQRLVFLDAQRVEADRCLKAARAEAFLLRATLDELDRVQAVREQVERRLRSASEAVLNCEDTLTKGLPFEVARTKTALQEAEQGLLNFPTK